MPPRLTKNGVVRDPDGTERLIDIWRDIRDGATAAIEAGRYSNAGRALAEFGAALGSIENARDWINPAQWDPRRMGGS